LAVNRRAPEANSNPPKVFHHNAVRQLARKGLAQSLVRPGYPMPARDLPQEDDVLVLADDVQ
jgi:hypothetical protein